MPEEPLGGGGRWGAGRGGAEAGAAGAEGGLTGTVGMAEGGAVGFLREKSCTKAA